MAATTAAQSGVGVAVFERSDRPGGRLGLQVQPLQGPKSIFKGRNGVEFCRDLMNELDSAGGHLLLNADVLAVEPASRDSDPFLLTCASDGSTATVEATCVVLATGSLEPAGDFPGADLDGIMLSNDVQRMVNVEGELPGRRVLMVGSDNAGLLIAADLIRAGAEVAGVVEAAPAVAGRDVNAEPIRVAGVEILTSTRVVAAHGTGRVDTVVLAGSDGRERRVQVDAVCLSPPRVPASELASGAGCFMRHIDALGGIVPAHGPFMGVGVSGLLVCGDAAGVENGAVALESGRVAGLSAGMHLGSDHPDLEALERLARARLGYLRRGRGGAIRRRAKAELEALHRRMIANRQGQHGTFDSYELADLTERRRRTGERYLEFLQASTLSMGLYELAAGDTDPQQPHTEDEVYYVVNGRAMIQVAGEDRPVQAGTVVFVEAGVDHRFHSIEEDLTVLVVFAPPRGSLSR